jgi:hypothetical protein
MRQVKKTVMRWSQCDVMTASREGTSVGVAGRTNGWRTAWLTQLGRAFRRCWNTVDLLIWEPRTLDARAGLRRAENCNQ